MVDQLLLKWLHAQRIIPSRSEASVDVLVLIGRIVFVPLFLGSAFAHLTQTKGMAGYAASKGVPWPEIAVLGSGLLILAGGLSILLGIWADLGALFLVAFLIPTASIMHAFWRETDPQARQLEMIQFQKDTALAGASLLIFTLFAYAGHNLGLTITGPLFSLH
jgi:putative oxidoreductase